MDAKEFPSRRLENFTLRFFAVIKIELLQKGRPSPLVVTFYPVTYPLRADSLF